MRGLCWRIQINSDTQDKSKQSSSFSSWLLQHLKLEPALVSTSGTSPRLVSVVCALCQLCNVLIAKPALFPGS